MRRLSTLLIAAPVMAGLLAAPAAHAEWRGQGGGYPYQGGGYPAHPHRHGHGGGPLLGALLGLGAAAVIGGIIASQPRYYQPPAYTPGPGQYYAPAYEQPVYQPAYPPRAVYREPGYPSARYPAYRGTEDDDAE